MSMNIPDTCVKCQHDKGTLVHCLWECLEIQKFWKEVIKCLSEIFKCQIPCCAKLCILGIYPAGFSRTKKQIKILDFGLLHARRTIDLNWTNMEAPSIELWIKELSEYIRLERLTYISKGKTEEFVQLWEPYMMLALSVKQSCIYLFIYLFIYFFSHLFIYIFLFIYLFICFLFTFPFSFIYE